jgi:tRNA modification GTPase
MEFGNRFDTICAIATPIGEGGIGIIKISGQAALPTILRIFQRSNTSSSLQSHRLHHGWIRDPDSGELVDEVLVGYMAAPNSYTREDVIEINCHSGFMVLNRILELVLKADARMAEPGEFTRRAFLNGRIDLSQAEAVIDTIRSASEMSLAAANRHLRGDFRQLVERWREHLLQLEAEVGASLDFADEVEDNLLPLNSHDSYSLSIRLRDNLCLPINEILTQYDNGRILREGLTVVLVGKPNVGKSSLLNALTGRDRAIVTPFPGTTRDVVEDSFLLCGALVRILDTAGIRRDPDIIESIGIDRTLRSLVEADVALMLIDQGSPLSEEDDLVFQSIKTAHREIILNKADLPPLVSMEEVQRRYCGTTPIAQLSALDSGDIDRLKRLLHERFLKRPLEECRSSIIPNLRHKECLMRASERLFNAEASLASGAPLELLSLDLQAARNQLDLILGYSLEEDLLDRIFSQFCIGK